MVEKIQHYYGIYKPPTPDDPAKRVVQQLTILARTIVSLKTARASDFKFLSKCQKILATHRNIMAL